MLKIILVTIAVLIAGLLIYASMQPDQFRIERSTRIQAPADRIFPLINDLHQWSVWSPYEKKDPGMKRTFSGQDSGTGAAYAWEGNSDVGSGRMEIVDITPPSRILIQLDFFTPFAARNQAEFTLADSGDSTQVTWAMTGPAPFLSKLICLFFDMEKMVGPDFEAGLADLKRIAETGS